MSKSTHQREIISAVILGVIMSIPITTLCLISSYFIFLYFILVFLLTACYAASYNNKLIEISQVAKAEIKIQYNFSNKLPKDMARQIISDFISQIDEIKLSSLDPRLDSNILIYKSISSNIDD